MQFDTRFDHMLEQFTQEEEHTKKLQSDMTLDTVKEVAKFFKKYTRCYMYKLPHIPTLKYEFIEQNHPAQKGSSYQYIASHSQQVKALLSALSLNLKKLCNSLSREITITPKEEDKLGKTLFAKDMLKIIKDELGVDANQGYSVYLTNTPIQPIVSNKIYINKVPIEQTDSLFINVRSDSGIYAENIVEIINIFLRLIHNVKAHGNMIIFTYYAPWQEDKYNFIQLLRHIFEEVYVVYVGTSWANFAYFVLKNKINDVKLPSFSKARLHTHYASVADSEYMLRISKDILDILNQRTYYYTIINTSKKGPFYEKLLKYVRKNMYDWVRRIKMVSPPKEESSATSNMNA